MILKINDFNLKDTILSGACFRVKEEKDGSFTNILKDRVVNLKQEENKLYIKTDNYENIKDIIYDYFDLNTDYDEINKELIKKDNKMKEIIEKCKGYKILNQDSFEMCISYIISQNNNVKRISKSIELLCEKYGEKVNFGNQTHYLFPKYEKLKKLNTNDFRELGVGFRDKYLKDFIDKYETLENINNLSTEDALKELMKVKGIGLKVASCILLFGYKRKDVFPIDTWVKQNIAENYNIKNDMKSIEKFAKEKYDKYSGLAIQYLFHSQRNL